jgi:hypothetical protein
VKNMPKLLNFSAEKDFSLELVQKIRRELPPSMLGQGKDASVNKITRVLERAYNSASSFQKEHQLGFIRRALLANNFKWTLKNNGYSPEFIDVATEGLVVAMSKKGNPKTAK